MYHLVSSGGVKAGPDCTTPHCRRVVTHTTLQAPRHNMGLVSTQFPISLLIMIMNLEHLLPHIHILHGWKKNQCISMHCNVHLVFHCAVRRNGWRKNMSSLGHITQLGWDWDGSLYNTVHGAGSWDGSTVVLTLCSWQTPTPPWSWSLVTRWCRH